MLVRRRLTPGQRQTTIPLSSLPSSCSPDAIAVGFLALEVNPIVAVTRHGVGDDPSACEALDLDPRVNVFKIRLPMTMQPLQPPTSMPSPPLRAAVAGDPGARGVSDGDTVVGTVRGGHAANPGAGGIPKDEAVVEAGDGAVEDPQSCDRVVLAAGCDDAISAAVAGERVASQDKAHAVGGDGDRRRAEGPVAGLALSGCHRGLGATRCRSRSSVKGRDRERADEQAASQAAPRPEKDPEGRIVVDRRVDTLARTRQAGTIDAAMLVPGREFQPIFATVHSGDGSGMSARPVVSASRSELAHLDIAKRTALLELVACLGLGPMRGAAGQRRLIPLAAFGCRSSLRRSFHGSLLATGGTGAGAGARAAFGRPRGRFGWAAGASSSAASPFRGRPGLRLAGVAAWGVSGSGRSAAGGSLACSSCGAGLLALTAGRSTIAPLTKSASSRSPLFNPSFWRMEDGKETQPS